MELPRTIDYVSLLFPAASLPFFWLTWRQTACAYSEAREKIFFEAERKSWMPRGGKREGAGRKSGENWKSVKPRPIRDMAKARVRQVLETASDPLAVLVDIANDPKVDVQTRVQAATAACPFMFPRLSASVVATAPATARDDTAHLVERLMHRFARLAPPVQTIEANAASAEAA